MKRLLAQLGITWFTVLAVAFYIPDTAVMILGCAALIAAIIMLIIKRSRKTVFLPAMALAAFFACVVNIGFTTLYVNPLIGEYSGDYCRVEAVVSDESYFSYSKHYYPLKVKSVDGEHADFKLLLSTYTDLEAVPDDIIRFDAKLIEENADYNIAKGYYLKAEDFELTEEVQKPETHSLYYHVIKLREMLRKSLSAYLSSDCASLCNAVFIGDKHALDHTVKDNFRYAGASYLIVVSGMHFAILCGLIKKLLIRLRSRWLSWALMLIFILGYMAVTGFRPSVMRSGLMMMIYITGEAIRRQQYSLNHLGAAGLLLPFFFTPYGIGDIGLILSFYATFAVLLWADPVMKRISFKSGEGEIYRLRLGSRIRLHFKRLFQRLRKEKLTELPSDGFLLTLKKLWNAVAAVLSVGIAANILVLPLSIYFFRAFSLVTLLSGVLLYGFVYLIMLLSLFVAVFYWLGPLSIISLLLSWPLAFCCKAVLWMVERIAGLPFAFVPVREDYYLIWLAVTGLLIVLASLCRERKRAYFTAVLGSVTILLTTAVTGALLNMNKTELHAYDCGSGLCTAVDYRGKLYMFTADAHSSKLYPVIRELAHKYGGAEAVLCSDERELGRYRMYPEREFAISKVLLYDNSVEAADLSNTYPVQDGSVFILDDGLTLRTSVSEAGVIPYITAGNKEILVIPRSAALDNIPADMRSPDIIVMSKAFSGADSLSCEDLIVSDEEPFSLLTADYMKDSFEKVRFTHDGEVVFDLR